MTDLTPEALRERAKRVVEGWEKATVNSFHGDVRAMMIRDITALVAEARREQRKVDARIAWPWADTYHPKPVDRRTVIADAERREIAAEILAEDRVGDAPRVQ